MNDSIKIHFSLEPLQISCLVIRVDYALRKQKKQVPMPRWAIKVAPDNQPRPIITHSIQIETDKLDFYSLQNIIYMHTINICMILLLLLCSDLFHVRLVRLSYHSCFPFRSTKSVPYESNKVMRPATAATARHFSKLASAHGHTVVALEP